MQPAPRRSRSASLGGRIVGLNYDREESGGGGEDEELYLFLSNRPSVPVFCSSDEAREEPGCSTGASEGAMLGALNGPATGIDDLLSCLDIGKHDYDWLVAPHAQQRRTESDVMDNVSVKSLSAVKMLSKIPEISVSQARNNQSATQAKIASIKQPSNASKYTSHFTSKSRSSTASTSKPTFSRPLTSSTTSCPTRKSTCRLSTAIYVSNKPSSPSSQSAASRPPTPVLSCSSSTSSADSNRFLQAKRPSTAPSRPETGASCSSLKLNLSAICPSSSSGPGLGLAPLSPNSSSSIASDRSMSRTVAGKLRPSSHPSTPGRNIKTVAHCPSPPDFFIDKSSNLHKRLTEKPASAWRTMASGGHKSIMKTESQPLKKSSKKYFSPFASGESSPKNSPSTVHTHGTVLRIAPPDMHESRTAKFTSKKPSKTASMTECTGFEKTIPVKSVDIAPMLQSMEDIPNASLFCELQAVASIGASPHEIAFDRNQIDGNQSDENYSTSSGGWSFINRDSGSGKRNANSHSRELLVDVSIDHDKYDSLRYDAIFLNEDSKSMNWLHSTDDSCDQIRLSFDPLFELLPEPFIFT